MPNILLTPNIIAKAALIVLQNNMVFSGLVHRDYSSDFVKKGDTITVRKPATFAANEHNGSSITIQDATETGVQVKMDKLVDVSFQITSKEMALSLEDFTAQFIAPAMRAHAQYLDSLLAGLYLDIPYNASVSGTPAISDWANVAKVLNQNKAPMTDRNMVLDPVNHAKYVVLDAILHAEKSGTTDALKNANIGKVLGFDSYMDQNIVTHTKGTATAGSATGTAGQNTIALASVTPAAGTFKKGDIITIAGDTQPYVVTADATAASGTIASMSIYPALKTSPAGAAITIVIGSNPIQNLAFHKNAFALVTRPLETPLGAAKAEVINYNGMSLRVVYGYDMQKKADIVSIDMLCGVKTLTPELACRLLG